ncbi:ComEA family DNA-binding protein [Stutzerimonas balearica]|uniref:ComEA family DNA-binding protein n=1 Tax=Stutzerimonas balearica TaxID=74829 RepID=UPI0028A7E7AB|nr:helix-hairpin-helix domain-containing protein [Stutzerimonas balearica]
MTKTFLAVAAFALLTSASLSGYAASPSQPAAAPASVAAAVGVVNLNTADAQTLTRELKGIGASKARAIVAYREEHGPFSSLDELLEVKGIGVSTLEKNRGKLSLN